MQVLKVLKITLLESFRKSISAFWMLFKIMFPVAILIRCLQLLGWLTYIGDFLSPVMGLMGLPGEMGIVWATTMLVNIYGGLFTYLALIPQLTAPLSVAQVSILATIMLIAHTFLIELPVAAKCGVRIWFIFLVRFVLALLAGILLNLLYSGFHWLEEPAVTVIQLQLHDSSWGYWLLDQLKNFALVFTIIFSMVLLINILDKIKVLNLINKTLYPLVKFMGISPNAIPSVLFGLTVGIAYGAGLFFAEAKEKSLSQKDLLYSMFLLGLCHSIIEDSLLMMSCGAHFTAILIFRPLFAVLCTWLFIKITRKTGIRYLIYQHDSLIYKR